MDLEDLRAFLAVAETGSFLTAAKALRLSRATLRRRIDELEARAGVPLLERTRLGATPTDAGAKLLARGRVMVQEASAVLESVREVGAEPSGLLRVLLPVGLPPHVLVPLLALLRERLPRLQFRLAFSDDPVGGLVEDVDLAVHFGEKSPPGPWIAREILRVRIWAVAHEDYLGRRGTPCSIDELDGHDLLAWEAPGEDGRLWPRVQGGTFQVAPLVVARHIHLVRQLAIAGQGIALVPDALFPDPGVEVGALVPVLPALVGRQVGVRVIVPRVLAHLPRIQAVLALLEPFLGKMRG